MADDAYVGSPAAALMNALGSGVREPEIRAVVGRAGVGKTALLVHVGLESLMRGRQVLHVALRDTVDHARTHCDEVLRAVTERSRLPDPTLKIERLRTIHSFHGRPFDVAAVDRNLAVLEEVAQFLPEVLLVDGFDSPTAALAHIEALRALSRRRLLRCWLGVRADDAGWEKLAKAADLTVRLTADGRVVQLDVVAGGPDVRLTLDPSSLLVRNPEATRVDDGEVFSEQARVSARECTLYSGGAAGTEAAFGEAAERWEAHEVNFTFDGHVQVRSRGRYELSPKELAVGDVSLAYVSKRLNRSYNDKGGLIRGVLQTLWHMVSRSQQVFVVGRIQDDGTVVGGTGWSVELARMWNRELWVFDQDKDGWYRWDGTGWADGKPRITAMHLCGTGTRYLSPNGKAAIEELFARSFAKDAGAAPN